MTFATSNLGVIDVNRRIVKNKTYHFGEVLKILKRN